MKNRYGPDGMVYGAQLDTSTGHIEINDQDLSESTFTEDEKPRSQGGFGSDEKQMLKQAFFKLNQ